MAGSRSDTPYIWYCPLEGLEYRCLFIIGWTVAHRLTVDGQDWVRMQKPRDAPPELVRCLN